MHQTADNCLRLALQGFVLKVLKIYFKGTCHHFQKPAGTSRAFVVHEKTPYLTIFAYSNCLCVLTSDVNDSTDSIDLVRHTPSSPW